MEFNTVNVEKCYKIMSKMNGDEVNEFLKLIPLKNLIDLITMGIIIFHDEFYKVYDQIKTASIN